MHEISITTNVDRIRKLSALENCVDVTEKAYAYHPTAVGLNDVDLERVQQMVDFVRSHSTAHLLDRLLPDRTPAHVAATLAEHCRFAHGSIMVFPGEWAAAADRLADMGLVPGPPSPSTVVRGRVAHRHGLAESELRLDIVHAAVPHNSASDATEVEIFVCSDEHQQIVDDERRHNHETHFAFQVTAPEQGLLEELWDLLIGPGRLIPDGGGFNPHEGPIGRTVLYFRTDGRLSPYGWPRRLELLVDGHHQVLARHLRDEPAEEDATRRMLELLTGAWATQALCAAAELGIADQLHAGPATSAELAEAARADADLLHRVLRYLASLGVVRSSGRQWVLTELGRTLRTGALRDVARLYGGVFYSSFGSLTHSVRTGQNAFEHAHGMAPFDYLNEHPDQARIFHGAMAAGSSWFAKVPEVIDFTGVGTVVDVAGGHGDLLARILLAAPSTRGILFDQAEVVDEARKSLDGHGLLDRCEVVGGDFTEQVPSGGDVYVLSRILHDWDDAQCARILANCRKAVPETGRLIIVERPIPADDRRSLAVAWDVHMSVNNVGGRERTEAEYRALLDSAGFALVDSRPLALDMAALTAVPRSTA